MDVKGRQPTRRRPAGWRRDRNTIQKHPPHPLLGVIIPGNSDGAAPRRPPRNDRSEHASGNRKQRPCPAQKEMKWDFNHYRGAEERAQRHPQEQMRGIQLQRDVTVQASLARRLPESEIVITCRAFGLGGEPVPGQLIAPAYGYFLFSSKARFLQRAQRHPFFRLPLNAAGDSVNPVHPGSRCNLALKYRLTNGCSPQMRTQAHLVRISHIRSQIP